MQEINGEWKVKCTSGPLWFRALNIIGDVKHIKDGRGYNTALIKWGGFTVEKNVRFDGFNFPYLFRYDDGSIIDGVWHGCAGQLVGRFYQNKSGEFWHIGRFVMARITTRCTTEGKIG